MHPQLGTDAANQIFLTLDADEMAQVLRPAPAYCAALKLLKFELQQL